MHNSFFGAWEGDGCLGNKIKCEGAGKKLKRGKLHIKMPYFFILILNDRNAQNIPSPVPK